MPKPKTRDRGLWCADIDWLLNVAPAALGERGILQSTIATLERGGAHGTGDPEHITDRQIGWCAGAGIVERWRALTPIWWELSADTRTVLQTHYAPVRGLTVTERVAAEGQLGQLAPVAVAEARDRPRLVAACVDKLAEGRGDIIRGAKQRAERRVRAAHASWYTFRELLGRRSVHAEARA